MNKIKHIVYKTTNKLTKEYYYGKHSGLLDDGYLGSGMMLNRAIREIGKDNFYREIVSFHDNAEAAFQRESEIVTKEMVSDLLCYNLIVGGAGREIKPVRQYNIDGTFIDEFDSPIEASKSTNIIRQQIRNGCDRLSDQEGFLWRYKEDWGDELNVKAYVPKINWKNRKKGKGIPVKDKTNNKCYKNKSAAARDTRVGVRKSGAIFTVDKEFKERFKEITIEEYQQCEN